jgi:hypothetical protein
MTEKTSNNNRFQNKKAESFTPLAFFLILTDEEIVMGDRRTVLSNLLPYYFLVNSLMSLIALFSERISREKTWNNKANTMTISTK